MKRATKGPASTAVLAGTQFFSEDFFAIGREIAAVAGVFAKEILAQLPGGGALLFLRDVLLNALADQLRPSHALAPGVEVEFFLQFGVEPNSNSHCITKCNTP